MKKLITLIIAFTLISPSAFSQLSFTAVANPAPFNSGGGLTLLPDGSVLCKAVAGTGDGFGNAWMKLTPDANGSYLNGTWSKVTPMRDTRLYFSSQVLKDGRLYIAGGEYGSGFDRAEIYNYELNTWTSLPLSVANVGDAGSDILDNGLILQACVAPPGSAKVMVYNPATNTYTNGPNTLQSHNESSWIKLRDGSILFVDLASTTSERYIPATNQWITDANVPVNLYDMFGFETGAAVLLPDGRAFFLGSTGNTAFYTPSGSTANGTWTAGPQIPGGLGCPDAAAAMMPNGKILMATGPAPTSVGNVFMAPTSFFEFDYTNNTFTQKSAFFGTTLADTAFNVTLLDLPDGNVLAAEAFTKNFFIYQPTSAPLAVGKPTITAIASNTCARTYTASGLLFNGISQGAYYGDDWQMNTNYPIFRLENGSQIYYCKSKNWNHTNIQRFGLLDTAQFEVPGTVPAGVYSLVVVANGIASSAFSFTLYPAVDLVSSLQVEPNCSNTVFSYTPQASAGLVQWTRPTAIGISNAAITSPQTSQILESLINTSSTTAYAAYVFTITSGACTNTRVLSVPVIKPIAPVVKGTTSLCSGKSGTIAARGFTSAAWSNGGTGTLVTVTPSASTVYSVIGTDDYGCISQAQFSVTVKPSPTLQVSMDTLFCFNEPNLIHVESNGSSIYFNNVQGNTNYIIVPTQMGTKTLSVMALAANGCTVQNVISYTVQLCSSVTELEQAGFQIAPNPVVDLLTIRSVAAKQQQYKFLSPTGVLLEQGSFVSQAKIDLSRYASGIYILQLVSEGNIINYKCLKQP